MLEVVRIPGMDCGCLDVFHGELRTDGSQSRAIVLWGKRNTSEVLLGGDWAVFSSVVEGRHHLRSLHRRC